ncbi:MAG: hypothetical protein FWC53_03970 [Firmicutes bacterium]|nr:hypothetical protein [Bacillota bacterium]
MKIKYEEMKQIMDTCKEALRGHANNGEHYNRYLSRDGHTTGFPDAFRYIQVDEDETEDIENDTNNAFPFISGVFFYTPGIPHEEDSLELIQMLISPTLFFDVDTKDRTVLRLTRILGVEGIKVEVLRDGEVLETANLPNEGIENPEVMAIIERCKQAFEIGIDYAKKQKERRIMLQFTADLKYTYM